jgi:hypothetical protein
MRGQEFPLKACRRLDCAAREACGGRPDRWPLPRRLQRSTGAANAARRMLSGGGHLARRGTGGIEDLGANRMLDALEPLLGLGGARLGGPRAQLGSG